MGSAWAKWFAETIRWRCWKMCMWQYARDKQPVVYTMPVYAECKRRSFSWLTFRCDLLRVKWNRWREGIYKIDFTSLYSLLLNFSLLICSLIYSYSLYAYTMRCDVIQASTTQLESQFNPKTNVLKIFFFVVKCTCTESVSGCSIGWLNFVTANLLLYELLKVVFRVPFRMYLYLN